ncbi:MAG: transposase [Pirellulaceae bacterium]|nr:transposase [Pirellulaceae bacterium]
MANQQIRQEEIFAIATACVEPRSLYRPRNPQASDLWRLLGRDDVVPGMIVAIQTHGQLLHWHPHLLVLITCGAFTPEGDFLELPEFDMERLLVAWQEAVFELYLAEKQACRDFPDPKGDGLRAGVPRNFQILSPLDFLAEFIQHIPPKGSQLIRYYGWYSNKSRGMRKKAEAAEPSSEEPTTSRSSQSWAMLIKRVYEMDPLC